MVVLPNIHVFSCRHECDKHMFDDVCFSVVKPVLKYNSNVFFLKLKQAGLSLAKQNALCALYLPYTVESQFLEPPWETTFGSSYQDV